MKIGNNLLLLTSPHPARKPRSFASLSLQRRSVYGRERRCYAGKELDNETGLYYYGARYLDPKTGRWLSGDPALGEYVPSAPVNEEAKKRNGSLPGMGGVFNCANLHVYHYAGNNPVKYVDPDGRESGFVMDENAVGGFGHAGMYVQTEKGYSFFEVTSITDNVKEEQREGKAEILSQSKLVFPTAGSAGSLKRPTEAGVVQRDFNSKEELNDYLAKNGFTTAIEFNTTTAQDKKIFNEALKQGKSFEGYNLIGNSCGVWAKDVLTSKGSGLINMFTPSFDSAYGGVFINNVPNYIGINLHHSNPGSTIRQLY